jgi:phenylalanyl-tRNA synthetase beta subunit
MANEGENILGLDGKVHTLNNKIMIIADKPNPIAIAGVMEVLKLKLMKY